MFPAHVPSCVSPQWGLPCQSVSTCPFSRAVSNASAPWEHWIITLPDTPLALYGASPVSSFFLWQFLSPNWRVHSLRAEALSILLEVSALQSRGGLTPIERFERRGIGYWAFPPAFLFSFPSNKIAETLEKWEEEKQYFHSSNTTTTFPLF